MSFCSLDCHSGWMVLERRHFASFVSKVFYMKAHTLYTHTHTQTHVHTHTHTHTSDIYIFLMCLLVLWSHFPTAHNSQSFLQQICTYKDKDVLFYIDLEFTTYFVYPSSAKGLKIHAKCLWTQLLLDRAYTFIYTIVTPLQL